MTGRLQQAARLYAARDYAAAEAVCHAIVHDHPHHFDALHLLGVLLTKQDRADEAVAFLRRADAAQPGHALLRINLGNALLAAKRFEEAVAVSLGGDAPACNNLGLAYRGLGRHEAAARAFAQATAARWDYAPGWFNLASTLSKLGRPEQALAAANTALRVAPLDTPVARLADVTNEIGRTLLELGRAEEALAACRRFLARHPDEASVVWNMSLCLLLLGRFEEGWRAYESRFDVAGHDVRPEGAVVLDPARIQGKRVLILSEQGRGDMLMFVRYAPLLTALGAAVHVQAHSDLVALLAAMPGVERVAGMDEPRPEADVVTSVMSLPLAFGVHPANVPYLRAPPGRSRLAPSVRPRVGVAWSGSSHSYERSAMPAETLAPLLALPGFEFHCLQKEIVEADRRWLERAEPLIALHLDRLDDFAGTAALIDSMDMVVTIDTAVAHLAGAMAKPVSLMLPFNPDWRWMLGRSDSPWYPSVRLFRQPRRGEWSAVVDAVIAGLHSAVRSRT